MNPRHVRHFARASGKLAGTDAIDASVLAHFADVMSPAPQDAKTRAEEELEEPATRRKQLKEMIVAEENRSRQTENKMLVEAMQVHLKWLRAEVAGTVDLKSLTNSPHLGQYKKQAKERLQDWRDEDPTAIARGAQRHPHFESRKKAGLALADAVAQSRSPTRRPHVYPHKNTGIRRRLAQPRNRELNESCGAQAHLSGQERSAVCLAAPAR